MKQLIVNADDFGYSHGVNKGIIEAHTKGIVTSTSVMVDSIAAREASSLKDYPDLAVGLHFVPQDINNVRPELDKQIQTFHSLMGRRPSHIDIHKVRQDDIELKTSVKEYSAEIGIPFRYSGKVKFIDSFFGPHSDGDVSIRQLLKSLDEIVDGINELMCHVGYADDYLNNNSSYNKLREEELSSICSDRAISRVKEQGIELTNWLKLRS